MQLQGKKKRFQNHHQILQAFYLSVNHKQKHLKLAKMLRQLMDYGLIKQKWVWHKKKDGYDRKEPYPNVE